MGQRGKLPALTQQELQHHFIVTVRDGVDPERNWPQPTTLRRATSTEPRCAVAALLSAEQSERLLHHPGVTAIEQDQPVHRVDHPDASQQ